MSQLYMQPGTAQVPDALSENCCGCSRHGRTLRASALGPGPIRLLTPAPPRGIPHLGTSSATKRYPKHSPVGGDTQLRRRERRSARGAGDEELYPPHAL
eukprot:CAMPEP_0176185538 /NCGR_PEP_ID=MMETSP0121_2-20121125/1407_1 /TAXON_ID=160619 /ORGANISM="Kryptoperidinium foliaceum, Strain CCMP 1326" /LENGTH=98 /DNA_ID=CAMNT_0017523997 /DNA_START=117 /DNA_END=409 /DNA_ORIENTATION=-